MPEPGEHIEFTYETGERPFDGERAHVELTNWWAAE